MVSKSLSQKLNKGQTVTNSDKKVGAEELNKTIQSAKSNQSLQKGAVIAVVNQIKEESSEIEVDSQVK